MAKVNVDDIAKPVSARAIEEMKDMVQAIRHRAWEEGYQACYEGKQRHNPYIKEKD